MAKPLFRANLRKQGGWGLSCDCGGNLSPLRHARTQREKGYLELGAEDTWTFLPSEGNPNTFGRFVLPSVGRKKGVKPRDSAKNLKHLSKKKRRVAGDAQPVGLFGYSPTSWLNCMRSKNTKKRRGKRM